MGPITEKESYQLFQETLCRSGFDFVRHLDSAGHFAGLQWQKSFGTTLAPQLSSALFHFIRRHSWLQISIVFSVKNVPIESEGIRRRIDICMASENLFQEFKEDHPKSKDGVLAASFEVKALLGTFHQDLDHLAGEGVWRPDMTLLGKPLSRWLVIPGFGFFPE